MGVRHDEALDPLKLIATYDDMSVVDIRDFARAHPEQLRILQEESGKWSAMAFRMGSGPWLIAWNPWHAETRTRVSLMEEVSHIILKHKPTKLEPCPITGLPKRTFTPSKEKQAYGVAGAALVPYNGMVALLRGGASVEEIAATFGVSVELARMRLNVTRAADAA